MDVNSSYDDSLFIYPRERIELAIKRTGNGSHIIPRDSTIQLSKSHMIVVVKRQDMNSPLVSAPNLHNHQMGKPSIAYYRETDLFPGGHFMRVTRYFPGGKKMSVIRKHIHQY